MDEIPTAEQVKYALILDPPAIVGEVVEAPQSNQEAVATPNDERSGEPQPETPKHPGGRPTVMTDQIVNKLREGFMIGYNVSECCAFTEISRETYYNWLERNPEYRDIIADWMEEPILKAKFTVFNNLNDPKIAAWYLERKRRDEFATRQEFTGGDEKAPPIKIEYVLPSNNPIPTDTQTTPSVGDSNQPANQ